MVLGAQIVVSSRGMKREILQTHEKAERMFAEVGMKSHLKNLWLIL